MRFNKIILRKKIYTHLMHHGKKSTCEKVFLKALKTLQKETQKNHKSLIQTAIVNTTPTIQLKQIKKKKRKTIKEFPFVLNKKNRMTQSIKSILLITNSRPKNKFFINFPEEILLTSNLKSNILKTKEIKHTEALLKKKYTFFRWFC